ncbi:DUF2058 domain-containing protein [Sedimenticola hydrogenitrophicus]|uniref:DUF2058 domain-containing protein n=1 Tax=Sedimenticola hydrogenitrophicus TaxID=2967975 RepID=UPI0023AF5A2C|nr:DUF2058 domain-containing protein [Sedimenticola hydrogenitrophicus]
MGISLQDQLLKAGLVDKKKASEVRKEKQKQAKQQRKGHAQSTDEVKQAAREAQRAQAERDRQLNLQRKAEADRRAVQAQIRQLIEMNRVALDEGQLAYSFTDGSKVKKLYVSEQIQSRLSRGQLAIARFDDHYAVVPIGVAEKIAQRDGSTIVLRNDPAGDVDEDDPYADFQVPDDLMW